MLTSRPMRRTHFGQYQASSAALACMFTCIRSSHSSISPPHPPICAANVLDHQSTTGIVALLRQCLSRGGGARCGEERVATLGSHLSLEGPPCSAIQSNWKILCQNILDGMYIHVYLFLRNFQQNSCSTQPGQHASLRLCTTTTVCIHVLSVECSGLLEKDLCH